MHTGAEASTALVRSDNGPVTGCHEQMKARMTGVGVPGVTLLFQNEQMTSAVVDRECQHVSQGSLRAEEVEVSSSQVVQLCTQTSDVTMVHHHLSLSTVRTGSRTMLAFWL